MSEQTEFVMKLELIAFYLRTLSEALETLIFQMAVATKGLADHTSRGLKLCMYTHLNEGPKCVLDTGLFLALSTLNLECLTLPVLSCL